MAYTQEKKDYYKKMRIERTKKEKMVDSLLLAQLTAMEASANAQKLTRDIPISTFGIQPLNAHPNGFNPYQVLWKRSGYRSDTRTGAVKTIKKSAYAQELEDIALPWVKKKGVARHG